jgi:hypothetical protein
MKAMIHDQGMPMFLWAEASNTIVYFQIRIPDKILRDESHEEEFTRVKVEIRNFSIFSFLLYIHVCYIPQLNRGTLLHRIHLNLKKNC